MYTEKIKIRVSSFVQCILMNDCQAFGFVKKDNSCNINAILNKLIPTLVCVKKERRKAINENFSKQLQKTENKKQEEFLCSCIDAIIDNIYFDERELNILDREVWVRPNQRNIPIFEEIALSETEITDLEMSTYLRQLLNEYSRLPQYRRENLCFRDEFQLIDISYNKSCVLNLKYGDTHYQVVVLNYVYGFVMDQNNYVICYDVKNGNIATFYLFAMNNLRILDKRFVPDEKAYEACDKIIDDRLFIDKEIFEIEEVLNESKNKKKIKKS